MSSPRVKSKKLFFPLLSGCADRQLSSIFALLFSLVLAFASIARAQQAGNAPGPALAEWRDDFSGAALDAKKWEPFVIEGRGEGRSELRDGILRQRYAEGARAGVRSVPVFSGSRFIVEAKVAGVGASAPQSWANAILALLFDGAGRERIEWIVRSDGALEAWEAKGGKLERIDDGQLKVSDPHPKLSIGRRGDDLFFLVNDQVKLQRSIRGLPNEFRVMLYGFGASENDWDEVRVITQGSSAQAVAPVQSGAASAAEVEVWTDEFAGDHLDEAKWEVYTFEGASGGKVEIKNGQLRMRGAGGSRSGVRSRMMWSADSFLVEATLARVGPRMPNPGEDSFPVGYAILAVLFDGRADNRIEWILRSDGIFEAWDITNGKFERLDNNNLATRVKNPRLGIMRVGDEISFLLNGQVGLKRTIRSLPRNFRVMLYGFGSSENDWEAISVRVPKR